MFLIFYLPKLFNFVLRLFIYIYHILEILIKNTSIIFDYTTLPGFIKLPSGYNMTLKSQGVSSKIGEIINSVNLLNISNLNHFLIKRKKFLL